MGLYSIQASTLRADGLIRGMRAIAAIRRNSTPDSEPKALAPEQAASKWIYGGVLVLIDSHEDGE